MSFTDEDLKILKDTRAYWEAKTQSPPELLTRLIERLEAAEKIVLYAIDNTCRYCEPNTIMSHQNGCPFLEDLTKWRSVAGK